MAGNLLVDSVVESATLAEIGYSAGDHAFTVLLKPGVMDPVAASVETAAGDLGIRVQGVRTPEGAIISRRVVVAAGTGSAQIAKQAGEPVPHQSVGGYHVMLQQPPVTLETPLLPLDFRFAITPMDTKIRLAGIYEFGGETLAFNRVRLDSMLAHIGGVLPGIDVTPLSVWRGFRSYLPDGLPIISASERTAGLFYLFGFSSSGMINGATAGRALGAIASGAAPELDLAPFLIGRFARPFSLARMLAPRGSRMPSHDTSIDHDQKTAT